MGFLQKAWNWIKGKGYTDTDIQDELNKIKEEERIEKLQATENIPQLQQPTIPIPQQPTIIPQQITQPQINQQKETGAKQEFKQAINRFNQSGSITAIQNKLNTTTMSAVEFKPTTNLGGLKSIYDSLLGNSTISKIDETGQTDEALVQILIENRKRLQHRFSAEITIQTQSSVGTIALNGILAEDLNDIYNYVTIGQTYTSQELKEAMNAAYSHFRTKYGIIGGHVIPPPETKSTVQDIKLRLTFA